LGKRFKVFEIREVIKLGTEGIEFGKGAGITIPHVKYNVLFGDD
jgi:hypothetical protein